ncbi:MAG: TonB family protein [Candidatus Zixiibacteriota bacterium]
MNLKPKITALMPYGAFELKRWYQWNMLMATLVTAAGVSVIWGGLALYKVLTAVDTENIAEITIESIMDLGPPPSIVQKPPQIEIAKPKLAQPKVGIPKPVADEEMLEEEVVLATKEELAQINVSELDFGEDGDVVVDIQDIMPSPDKFISVEVQPKFVNRVTPEYPRLARTAHMEGTVWVKILVDKSGKVRDAIIAKASGANAGFEEAALTAAKKCSFSPAIQNGLPVAIWVTFPFKFELD